jgi:hypothetical protein
MKSSRCVLLLQSCSPQPKEDECCDARSMAVKPRRIGGPVLSASGDEVLRHRAGTCHLLLSAESDATVRPTGKGSRTGASPLTTFSTSSSRGPSGARKRAATTGPGGGATFGSSPKGSSSPSPVGLARTRQQGAGRRQRNSPSTIDTLSMYSPPRRPATRCPRLSRPAV